VVSGIASLFMLDGAPRVSKVHVYVKSYCH